MLSCEEQGWNRVRAELEVEKILQRIERHTWVPPRLEPREDRQAEVWRYQQVSTRRYVDEQATGLGPPIGPRARSACSTSSCGTSATRQ